MLYWTCAETSVAHLCAAALAIRPLYVKLRDRFRKKHKVSNSSETEVFSGASYSNTRSIPGLSRQQVVALPGGPGERHNDAEMAGLNWTRSLSLEKSSSGQHEVNV